MNELLFGLIRSVMAPGFGLADAHVEDKTANHTGLVLVRHSQGIRAVRAYLASPMNQVNPGFPLFWV